MLVGVVQVLVFLATGLAVLPLMSLPSPHHLPVRRRRPVIGRRFAPVAHISPAS